MPFATQVSLAPKSMRYDPIADFQPVANLGTSSFVLCVPASLPVKTVGEFVAYAKANAGKLSYAGTSRGSVTHLSTEMFKRATGTEMEFIGYAGIPPALTDLVGGRLQFMSVGIVAAMPQIKAGKLRPLAVLDAERHPLLPDVPSIAEAGFPDLAVSTWFGIARAGTDAAGHRPAHQRGDDEDRPLAGHRREVQGHGREPDRRQHARAVRRVPEGGHRALAQGDQGREHRHRMTRAAIDARIHASTPAT